MAETKPIKYIAVVDLSYEDGSTCAAGEPLSRKQAARLEDEDLWLLDQELVVKAGE